MVAISFSVFKEKILSGEKKQTIRPYSKKRWNSILKNKKLQLYWKQRTKECEFLKEVELEEMFRIRFEIKWLRVSFLGYITVLKEEEDGSWKEIDSDELDHLARCDGFENCSEMTEWFFEKYGYGIDTMIFMVIRWR